MTSGWKQHLWIIQISA